MISYLPTAFRKECERGIGSDFLVHIITDLLAISNQPLRNNIPTNAF